MFDSLLKIDGPRSNSIESFKKAKSELSCIASDLARIDDETGEQKILLKCVSNFNQMLDKVALEI